MNTTPTTTTAPAAAGLAIASLAVELVAAGIAAVLIPVIALVLALAGYGHDLVAARRRAEAAEAAEASPVPAQCQPGASPVPASTIPAPELQNACDASYRDLWAAVIEAQRIKQLAAYNQLAAQQVTTLRSMARDAGHRQLARKGRRGQLLAALVPA